MADLSEIYMDYQLCSQRPQTCDFDPTVLSMLALLVLCSVPHDIFLYRSSQGVSLLFFFPLSWMMLEHWDSGIISQTTLLCWACGMEATYFHRPLCFLSLLSCSFSVPDTAGIGATSALFNFDSHQPCLPCAYMVARAMVTPVNGTGAGPYSSL